MTIDSMTETTTSAHRPSATENRSNLLEVINLSVVVRNSQQRIIEDVNLNIETGEVLALVGESGSGKSVTGLALAQLLPDELSITSGAIVFDGDNIIDKSEADLNSMRGADISMLFQQPHTMLDPTSRVHSQVSEPLRLHQKLRGRTAFSRAVELLKEVGIPSPQIRARSFSHELSGGMAQRVMLAAALAADPRLLIADEPTTALDVTVQAQILRLLKTEQALRKFSILLITHDLSIVSVVADRVAVMYAGRIVEEGPVEKIMRKPAHPYTRDLIRCSLLEPEADGKLRSIPGSGVQAQSIRQGCRFAPRCSVAQANRTLLAKCTSTEPALQNHAESWLCRCHAVPRF